MEIICLVLVNTKTGGEEFPEPCLLLGSLDPPKCWVRVSSTQGVLRNHARQPPLPSEAPTTVVGLCLAQSAAMLNFEVAISLDVFFAKNSLKQ